MIVHCQEAIEMCDEFKSPLDCSTRKLQDFYRMVLKGRKVEKLGLKCRIRKAKLLAFHYEGKTLAGIAAIKVPTITHKKEVFLKAGVGQESDKLDLEVGWAFTLEEHRGNGICSHLVNRIVETYRFQNMFAITETTNSYVQKVLERNNFQKIGKSYKGKLDEESKGEYWLQLFTRMGRTEHANNGLKYV